ncbi:MULTISPECIES: CHAT domain-containing protein [unclassified Coleofasciculus]|uniref:CHAT domain-containing protein n=1 Tax=unclassified Coleofasciculus TaxID=2692782 RepID=UPI0018817FD5|nr:MULTISPECIES: tetratricopeptide repeat protein [unclassified Coleofasciculus]MBE9126785.1 tetratricopeptide repeat protein [Coleofasciculus sp. LEGE 07081]MBE9150156.1 tetratricopeptide repeat protein [Coleofasciculus sp. LEGE 07092]
MRDTLKHLTLVTATSLLLLNLPLPLTKASAQAPAPTYEEKITEGAYLNQEGWQLLEYSQFPAALEKFQQALAIFKQYDAKEHEGQSFDNIGTVYLRMGDYSKALEFFEQALTIRKAIGDEEGQGYTLDNIGEVYTHLNQYPKALEFYQQALAIYKKLGDRIGGYTYPNLLQRIVAVHFRMGEYPQALEFYQQLLPIYDRGITKAQSLNNIGVVYVNMGKYAQALDAYEEALTITTTVGDCYGTGSESRLCFYGDEAAILNNLGAAYFSLGQYQKALEFAQRSSDIYSKFRDRSDPETTSNEIKLLYDTLGQNSQALGFFSQDAIARANVGDAFGQDSFMRAGQALNLNNIAQIYSYLGNYDQALTLYQQALALYQDVGDRTGQGIAFSNIGQIYQNQNQEKKAEELYQQALVIHREVGDLVSEGETLKRLGQLLEQRNQPELAIVFYKQSVNVTEDIRKELRVVPVELQQSYTEKVADRYRSLADLLLKQNRTAEAQQVLDLLKVQEIDDYLQNEPENNPVTVSTSRRRTLETTSRTVSTLPQEEQFSQKYAAVQNQAIALGKELTQLRQIKPENRTPDQEKRIAELVKAQEQIIADFNTFIESPEVLALVDQLSRTGQKQDLLNNLEELISLQDNLKKLNQNAVLLYPLILDDRLELVLTTPDSPPIHRTVKVTREQLNQTITAFRQALLNPTADAKTPAQQLYNWLIKPLEAELQAADAQTIIYAPDGQLRYIPLTALYDGQQWLVQRYRINNITAASLTELNTKPQPQIQILAEAFTSGYYSVDIRGERFNFSGLPFAGVEVETLAETIPTTTQLRDTAFNPEATVPKMDDYTVVHFATHAAFVVGQPQDSFILFGNGERVTLEDAKKWNFKTVDLVVLSACETGLGGKLGNGDEILGFGYLMQRAGARAAIASLWTVDDGGTQLLMNGFYTALQQGNVTKAEALRQAQIALITGDDTALGKERGTIVVQQRLREGLKPNVANRLSHPYYWAPFILIGNGL